MLALPTVKMAVSQLTQTVLMGIGVYFIGNGLTTEPPQGSLSPDAQCVAPIVYYERIATLQTYEAACIVFTMFLLVGLRVYLETLGAVAVHLPWWKRYGVRASLLVAAAGSFAATGIAAAVFYNIMLVKVGLDKQGCLPPVTKAITVAAFTIVGATALAVHCLIGSVAFREEEQQQEEQQA